MEPSKGLEAGGAAAAQRQSSSPLLLIAALLFLTGLGAGAGGLFGFLVGGKEEHGTPTKAATAVEAVPKGGIGESGMLQALPAVVTNLASPEQTRVRIEASVVLDGDTKEDTTVLTAKIAEDFAAYLRTVPLAYMEGGSGFQNLREDLSDRSRVRSNGKVRDLIIQAFIIE
jgi:flagellar protein FliL